MEEAESSVKVERERDAESSVEAEGSREAEGSKEGEDSSGVEAMKEVGRKEAENIWETEAKALEKAVVPVVVAEDEATLGRACQRKRAGDT
eukprot:4433005-Pleurochrysis_carterae.AAC.1